jgi:hypothetical protein
MDETGWDSWIGRKMMFQAINKYYCPCQSKLGCKTIPWKADDSEQIRSDSVWFLSFPFFFGCSLPFLNESILNPDLECTWGIYPFRLSANADNIVFLQETKVANISQHIYLSVFGSAYDNYVALPANGTRGVLGHMKINLCSCKNLEMLGHTLQVSY